MYISCVEMERSVGGSLSGPAASQVPSAGRARWSGECPEGGSREVGVRWARKGHISFHSHSPVWSPIPGPRLTARPWETSSHVPGRKVVELVHCCPVCSMAALHRPLWLPSSSSPHRCPGCPCPKCHLLGPTCDVEISQFKS